MKVLSAIVKFIVKEFALIICIGIISFPLAYLLTEQLESKSAPLADALKASFPGTSLFVLMYLLVASGLYLSRMVAGAIKTLIKPQAS